MFSYHNFQPQNLSQSPNPTFQPNLPSQKSYFHQFNHPLPHSNHSLPFHPNPSIMTKPSYNPVILSEISPQSNTSTQPTAITVHPEPYDPPNDDALDLKSLYNQPIISPDDFFNTSEPIENPVEDLEDDKISNLEIHQDNDETIEKQGKKVISKLPRQDSTKMRKRNMWSNEEDSTLLECIELFGKKWTKISRMIPGRTGKQVRDRYLNVLIPDIKREEWNEEEDEMISKMYESIGAQWCKIAENVPGRTEAQVKNRYYTYLKKISEGKKVVTRPKNPMKMGSRQGKKDGKGLQEEEEKGIEEDKEIKTCQVRKENWVPEDVALYGRQENSLEMLVKKPKVMDIMSLEGFIGDFRGFDDGFMNEEGFI